jgi:hypothetical protein
LISITLRFDCASQQPAVPFHETVDLGVLPPGVYEVVAGPNNLLVAIADAKLTVREAAPALQISPNVGVPLEIVTIRGAGIAAVCAIAPCPPPEVFFGDKKAQVLRTPDTNTVVVAAPEHVTGVVDVTLRSPTGQTFQSIAAFYVGFRDPAFVEPVLVPVAISGAGAFGSQWTTEVTARNESDFPFPTLTIFDNRCQPSCDIRMPPHTTRLVRPDIPNGNLFFISRESSPKIFFKVLVRDLSRQAEALGTEVPVVREKDFFDRPFTLLNVPNDSRYRVALRLYRIDGGMTLRVRIRKLEAVEGFGPEADEPLLVDVSVALQPQTLGLASRFVGDLLTTFPQLAGKGPLRIEIDETSAQRATWAFVSVTNNVTQHVTVISPN